MTETSGTLRSPRSADFLRDLPWKAAFFAGIGASFAIGALVEANAFSGLPFIIAPFGASCALVFGAPSSPLAHPRNVIGGHLISATLGLLAMSVIADPGLAMAVGVGLAIAGMLLTGTLHPPAGANPIVVVLASASWGFLLTPLLAGVLVIVVLGAIYHRTVTGHTYVLSVRR